MVVTVLRNNNICNSTFLLETVYLRSHVIRIGHYYSEKVADFEDAEYPIYLTPIILAAKLHRVEIIQLLNDEGHSEIHPISGLY